MSNAERTPISSDPQHSSNKFHDEIKEENDKHLVMRVSSDPTNPSRTPDSFSPVHQPTIVERIVDAAKRHKKGIRNAAATVAVGGVLVGAPVAHHKSKEAKLKGDTGLEEAIFANTDLKPLNGETTKVIIRGGASVRTSPVTDEDKANGNNNVAFQIDDDKTYEVTKGVYYNGWVGFQLPDVQLGESPSAADVAAHTLWVNLDKLKGETRTDGTTFASEYPLGESAQPFTITLGADGHFHDEQQNIVAMANIVEVGQN